MSAIAGIYHLDGRPVERAVLTRMMSSVAHRGPDGEGAWCEGAVGLGHRMLRTTPESLHERLPLADASGSLVLTADARLDNRRDLIAALGLSDRPRAEITDGQLLLAAYEKWGADCPARLLGDFAFCIWDGRKQLLFCARDAVGVKPFYYYQAERLVVFASEIKALLTVPEVPRRLNEVKVADHLVGLCEDQAITFYRDIFRLPAAHGMTVSRRGVRVWRYWSLDPTRELRLRSDEEYAESFREIFTEAVRCRLRSTSAVGATLSGGLDSSAIACTARQELTAKGNGHLLHTFSAIFPGLPKADQPKIDERPYVKAVISAGRLKPHFIRADRLSPLADLDQVLWHEDEAFDAPNLYLHWAIYGAANRHGVRVLLDGFDGDTTVSHGLSRLSELARAFRWMTLMAEARALSQKSPSAYYTPRRIIWLFGVRPLAPASIVRLWRAWRGRTEQVWPIHNSVINPAFARRVDLRGRVRTLLRDDSKPASATRRAHWQGLTSALIPYTLEVADKAAAAFALEARYPFFDRRLMEFCLALPAGQKLDQGWTRVVMRRAMAGMLPQEIQWRTTKANLSPNFVRRLLDREQTILEEVIMKEPQVIEEYINLPALRAEYDKYAGRSSLTAEVAQIVYNAVILGHWLRTVGLPA